MDLLVNGRRRRVDVEPERTLLSVLRDDLDLTGCKYGCGEGQCGACTVLLAGTPARSCITPVGTVGDREVTTIQGLAADGALHPVQEAFIECGAMQCGYCTPGMVLASVALLAAMPNPTEAQIVTHMNGNVCRCGTYPRIVEAIRRAADTMAGGAK